MADLDLDRGGAARAEARDAARNFATYGTLMDAALRLKFDDIVPWLPADPAVIVDKGFGTGSFDRVLLDEFPEASVVGLDASRRFVKQALHMERFTPVFGDITEQNLPDGYASAVVLASVLHEVYSYCGYSKEPVRKCLQSSFQELASGGRIVIRDMGGVPAGGNVPVYVDCQSEAAAAQFDRFFADQVGVSKPIGRVAYLNDAIEFMLTKDYVDNWSLEVQEHYTALSAAEVAGMLEEIGYRVLTARTYANDWIVEHRLRGQVGLVAIPSGAALAYPATHYVVAGEKP
jgi:trans-aconitate methyltransferase